ncbi:hypothetical protein E5D57_007346 [Metarhizium anisopliae]|nr:hypothetical protein E5D57_007346 [Metarhizium anisopliae]
MSVIKFDLNSPPEVLSSYTTPSPLARIQARDAAGSLRDKARPLRPYPPAKPPVDGTSPEARFEAERNTKHNEIMLPLPTDIAVTGLAMD